MVVLCAMARCSSHSRLDLKERSFYRFPIDEERCKQWVDASGRPELWQKGAVALHKSYYLCDLHFQQKDRLQKKLRSHAVPIPYSSERITNDNPCKSTQTDTEEKEECNKDIDINCGASTSKCNINTERASSIAKSSLNTSHEIQALLPVATRKKYNLLSTELRMLIDLQVRLNKIAKEKKCAFNLELFALNLCLSRPLAYKVIRGMLDLPSEKKLRKCKMDIDTNVSNVMHCLESKMKSLNESDKYCTVCIDRMPLKRFLFYHINKDRVIGFLDVNGQQIAEPATEVYVVMARGLSLKWEQPIAYCFLDKNQDYEVIDAWLDDVISQIMDIGFKVIALVTDHQDFYHRVKNRIVSFAQPYFCINEKKIYCIFDVPQLIKSLRNSLMKHEFEFKDGDGSLLIANWDPIKALYLGFSEYNNVCVVPKLTNSHINPNESEKKEIKYAAQVFSKSVSQALDMESRRRVEWQNNKVRGTQKLTALVNDAFDILNSSSVKHQNEYKNAFTGEPYQMKALREFMEFLTNVRISDDSDFHNSYNCINGLRISIMSIITILRDLKSEGIHSLLTQRFSLNALGRFFDSVRLKANCEKPTPVQFFKAFRQLFMAQLFRRSKSSSRTDDLRQLVKSVDIRFLSTYKLKSVEFQKTIEVGTVDYRFDLPKSNTFRYVCGYLLKKCYKVHSNCLQMERYIHSEIANVGILLGDQKVFEYLEPPKTFIELIKRLDERFNACFGNNIEIGLGTGALMGLNVSDITLKSRYVCECFPIKYLGRLFVRFRIFNIIRYNNRNFRDESFDFSNNDHYSLQ